MELLARTPNLGKVSGALAESLAYLTSPSRIDGEIAHFERAIAAGHDTPENRAQLSDWQAVRAAQKRLLTDEEGGQA